MISDKVEQKCEKLLLEQKQNVLGQIKIYSNMHINSDNMTGVTEEIDGIAQTDINGKNEINRKKKK